MVSLFLIIIILYSLKKHDTHLKKTTDNLFENKYYIPEVKIPSTSTDLELTSNSSNTCGLQVFVIFVKRTLQLDRVVIVKFWSGVDVLRVCVCCV